MSVSSRNGLPQPGSRRVRRLAQATAVAAAGIAIALGTTGCGAGQISQTANQLPAVNGANANLGQIELRDVQIIYPTDNAAEVFDKGGPFQLSWVIANGSDTNTYRLLNVTAKQGTVTLSGKYDIMPGKSLRAGYPAALIAPQNAADAEKRMTATLDGTGDTVAVGLTTPLTFTFAQVNPDGSTVPAGDVTVTTPVDSGTLLTRQDKVREAEQPADEHAYEQELPGH
ncbi:hypothetical protein [Gordonia sp. NPDC003429]